MQEEDSLNQSPSASNHLRLTKINGKRIFVKQSTSKMPSGLASGLGGGLASLFSGKAHACSGG